MERCDRCGGRTHMRYEQADRTLLLCERHAITHGARPLAGGWFAYRVAEKVDA